MKTIKQIADEIGVSKQAVSKRIAREPLCTCIHQNVHTQNGIKYIDVVGENLVKQAFLRNASTTMSIDVADNQSITCTHMVVDVVTVLQATIDTLQKQLEVKDTQISALQSELAEERKHSREQADKLAVLADQAQKLHAGTMIDGQNIIHDGGKSTAESNVPPNGFFGRLVWLVGRKRL